MKKYLCILLVLTISVLLYACGETTIPTTEEQTTVDPSYYSKNPNIKYMYEENYKLYHDGLVLVEGNNGKFGYLNTDGEVVIDFIYDYASIFWDGAAIIFENGYYGLIDTSGDYILYSDYETIHRFPNYNLFVVKDKTTHKVGVFLSDGSIVLDFIYDFIPISLLNDDNSYIIVTKIDNLYGFTALDGEEITSHEFTFALDFNKSDYAPIEYNYEWGYIDREGKSFLATEFNRTYPFIDNSYGLISDEDHLFGIQFANKTTIHPMYNSISVSDFGYVYMFNDLEEKLVDVDTAHYINFDFETSYTLHKGSSYSYLWNNVIYFADGTTKLYLGDDEFLDSEPGETFVNNNAEVIIVKNDDDQYKAIDYAGHIIKDFSDEVLSAYGEESSVMKYSDYFYGYTEDLEGKDITNVYLNDGTLVISGKYIYMNGTELYPYVNTINSLETMYQSEYILVKDDVYKLYNNSHELILTLGTDLLPLDISNYSIYRYTDNYLLIKSNEGSFVIDLNGNVIIPAIYPNIDDK